MTELKRTSTTAKGGKVLHAAKIHTTGGRANGISRSADGQLDVKLSPPGSGRSGTDPEQRFGPRGGIPR